MRPSFETTPSIAGGLAAMRLSQTGEKKQKQNKKKPLLLVKKPLMAPDQELLSLTGEPLYRRLVGV